MKRNTSFDKPTKGILVVLGFLATMLFIIAANLTGELSNYNPAIGVLIAACFATMGLTIWKATEKKRKSASLK